MSLFIRTAQTTTPANPATFQKLLGVHFLSRQSYAPNIESRLRATCERLRTRDGLTRRQLWLGTQFRDAIRQARCPSLTIGHIDGSVGFGLFTNSDLPTDSFIGLYTGEVRHRPLLTLRDTRYCFRLPNLTTFGPHYLIDALHAGNHTRFINHSDRPNVEACSAYCDGFIHMILRTLRPLLPNDELLMDYGPLYWRHRKKK
jgi:uncharacterized protein